MNSISPKSSPIRAPVAASTWRSPLGNPAAASTHPVEQTVVTLGKRLLFSSETPPVCTAPTIWDVKAKARARTGETIQERYPSIQSAPQEVIQLLEHIEGIAKELPLQQVDIRTCVCHILAQNNDFEDRMAELGLFLFYLDRDRQVTQSHSYVANRAAEMESEIRRYIRAHELAGHPPLPTGKTHYIMRAFAHMVLTSKQIYNPGGLYAIQQLLKSPCTLSQYLQPEHRHHILTVTTQILSSPLCVDIFRTSAKVHDSLKEIIRLDLKLKPEEQVLSVHILYDCLMALMSDIRQANSGNCYAVAALIYAEQNYLPTIFTHLLQWLEAGHYVVQGTQVPLRPLLEHRLNQYHDPVAVGKNDQITQLACIEQMFGLLSLQNSPLPASKGNVPLRTSIGHLLGPENTAKHLAYIERLLPTYKQNALVHLMLKVLELVNDNDNCKPTTTGPSQPSELKERVIDTYIDKLQKWCKAYPEAGPLIDQIKGRLLAALWLEYHSEREVSVYDKTICYGLKSFAKYAGDPKVFAELLRCSTRLYYLKDGIYKPLLTFEALQNAVADQVRAVCDAQPTPPRDVIRRRLISGALSASIKDRLAELAAAQINKKQPESTPISKTNLISTEALIFAQTGGCAEQVLEWVLGIKTTQHHLPDCNAAEECIEKLSKFLQQMDPAHFQTTPKVMIKVPGYHVWTVTPSHWVLTFESRARLSTFIVAMHQRADRFLKSHIPERVKQSMNQSTLPASALQTLSNPNITYRAFRDHLLRSSCPSEHPDINATIETEFNKMELTTNCLRMALLCLNLRLTYDECVEIRSHGTSAPKSLHEHAREIRQGLMMNNRGVFDPYEIEQALCTSMDLPQPVYLGDLNWGDVTSEAPHHTQLVLQYSWIENRFRFFTREKNSLKREPDSKYTNFKIFTPPLGGIL